MQPVTPWSQLPDAALLELRICDLKLRLPRTALEGRVAQLYAELEGAGQRLRPHVWLSRSWFSPQGVPGIAIPFSLAHPRLVRLERDQMNEVEGGRPAQCMRLLRHEAGHAIDTAFRLRRRRRWRELFGRSGDPYSATYSPNARSRDHVVHLDYWYAQSHPLEDFAETFAVWLDPRSRWRRQYAGWRALRKLEYVDELMSEIRNLTPVVSSQERTDSLPALRMTLGEYYRRKRARYGVEFPSIFDADLRRLFTDDPPARRRSAAGFLTKHHASLLRAAARAHGHHPLVLERLLGDLVARSRALGLFLAQSERASLRGAKRLLEKHVSRIQRTRALEFAR